MTLGQHRRTLDSHDNLLLDSRPDRMREAAPYLLIGAIMTGLVLFGLMYFGIGAN